MEVKPGYRQTEVGVIPEEWEVVSIGSLASFTSGCGISVAALRQQSPETPIPVYGGNGIAGFTRSPLVNEPVVVVGRVGQKCGEVYLTKGPAWITDNALYPRAVLRKIDVRYMALALTAAKVNSLKNRNDLPLVTQEILHSVHISLPPTKAEQEAIAEALSDADALIESLQQLIVKKRQLKQGAMQELLTGKNRLPGFSGEWEVKQLGEVATFHKGKGLPKSAIEPFGAEPCIHYGELFTQYPETIREVLSSTNNSDNGFRSVANDVLMPTSDVTPTGLAKASCVRVNGIILGGDILVIRADANRVFGSFLSYAIRHAEDQILQLVTGTTVFHLYAADMNKFTFLMPLVSEQQAIVAVLDDMDTDIAALETKLTKTRRIKQGMMQELLTGKIRLV